MEIYLVGGAVRDELLGLPVKERDWVVVGATPEAMLRLGYRQVGRDFPVFLHPTTDEEYALARTERKVARGHTGFECHAGPDVTLEQDLARRDLTINAMAKRTDGTIVDPWRGREDLDARSLRHVSPAFTEDPLRVFRVARLAARFGALGFTVAESTMDLIGRMAREGALQELAAERVGVELAKALETETPARFFEVLRAADALDGWFPEVTIEASRTLARVATRLGDACERFGALGWELELDAARALAMRLKLPRDWLDSIETVARDGRALMRYASSSPESLFARLKSAGALRRVRTFERALDIASAASAVVLSPLRTLAQSLRSVGSASARAAGLEGKALGQALDRERIELVRAFLITTSDDRDASPNGPPTG